ncbi:MAG: filamentous hemagglutinin family protein [Terrimicrobiaceae bacterium]
MASLSLLGSGRELVAGDILRCGATTGAGRRAADARANASAAAAELARTRASDRLARTTQVVNAMRQMQTSARSATGASVPDGLVAGGLERLAGGVWTGAADPVQSGDSVSIRQTGQQALLNWKTFNVGKSTSLYFDQTAGGGDSGKWIAFNKVTDSSGKPSQILGSIKADGQVYVINQNGIIFGAGSQVNARALVASSLPINANLVERGLLNQEAGKPFAFLFESATATGDVVVEAGASIQSPVGDDGNGGRVMLVGSNVRNSGTLTTPAGQTILAAGRQVGIDSHRQSSATMSDPSLRGIDVYIGGVGTGGTATNEGIIDVARGSAWIAGKTVNQSGVVESSTSVSLNGRIDLKASYGAIPNPSYEASEFLDEVFPFSPTLSGTVTLGPGSLIRILPETGSSEKTVGTELALRSAINMEGRNIHFAPGATLLAPNARVSLKAGIWGSPSTEKARLILSGGQIYFDTGVLVDVSGTVGVSALLEENILNIQLRGSELADSPLQRNGPIRGLLLTVDTRKSGSYGGREWIGTPLGDASGFGGLIERGVGALTTAGGSVEISAGEAFVFQKGATIDVSGGWTRFEGGKVQTTRLLENGHLVDIADATPDREYDGIYTGQSSKTHAKWGVTTIYGAALAPIGQYIQQAYYHGADAGSISVSAPAMALDGDLFGGTIAGQRQLRSSATSSDMPYGGSLILSFRSQDSLAPFYTKFPTPPNVIFQTTVTEAPVSAFTVNAPGQAAVLPAARVDTVVLDPALFSGKHGFGSLTIDNEEGSISVPSGIAVTLPAGVRLSLTASNIRIGGSIIAPSGSLEFKALNISPYDAAVLKPQLIAPVENSGRGLFTLEPGAVLSAAGLLQDDRSLSEITALSPFSPHGGSVKIEAYIAKLAPGSLIDVSGGFSMPSNGNRKYSEFQGYKVFSDYGDAGSITIAAGRDPNEGYIYRGSLELDSVLRGFGGGQGGSLAIQAPLVQVGGASTTPGVLLLQPGFFSTGGFASYSITGLGAPAGSSGEMLPAVLIVQGTLIEPVAQTVRLDSHPPGGRSIALLTIGKPVGERRPASLSFLAPGIKDFDGVSTLVRGDLVFGEGAVIRTDPGASVAFSGNTAAILGSIFAPGGNISISGGKNSLSIFPPDFTQALTSVYIGPRSVLSAAGTFLRIPDAFGRVRGRVLPGGSLSVSGNIVAAAGSLLDVSGSSALVDLLPGEASPLASALPSPRSGLTAPLASMVTVATRVDSDGGTISLSGGQMLFFDATLRGGAGGPTALGGNLIVSSGRFYPDPTTPVPVFDSNLVVTQSGKAVAVPLPDSAAAIGRAVRGPGDTVLISRGYFAADQFLAGGFDSLELNGSVEFAGPVEIAARRELYVAGAGVLRANAPVQLSAPYVAIGQAFQAPVPFADLTHPFGGPPTYGTGQLSISANWIDVGSLSLQGIGRASLWAVGGDIRGIGVFDIAGDLVLKAAQIYPTTASSFTIVAYGHTDAFGVHPGSVTLMGSGAKNLPLSAAGRLGIFASNIYQAGTLRAPLGQIILGWDGTGTPPITLTAGTLPTTSSLTLAAGSLTSVSAVDASGHGLLIPFGLSTDGETWIDPTGVDISGGGLVSKGISLSGTSITTEAGSVADLRGGGDLYAYQWVGGTGGSTDLLGTTTQSWNNNNTYRAGDLVLFTDGNTYSARRTITPSDFASSSVPDPTQDRYWTRVPESFAVLPGYDSDIAPFAPFNSKSRILDDVETNLILDQGAGYVSRNLKPGDKIYLRASRSLPAGYYTLLPARYALLPGAVLVTPSAASLAGGIETPEGASLASGYRFNSLNSPRTIPTLAQQFEVLSQSVLRNRAEYADFFANDFLADRAAALDIGVPRLPKDSGSAVIQATQAMSLKGRVLSPSVSGGRGARMDLSSASDFAITSNGAGGGLGVITLDASVLNSFGVEMLLIGGLRTTGSEGTNISVRTGNITLNNLGAPLSGPEIILVANNGISLAAGSSILSTGPMTSPGDDLLLNGNGILLRVSGDSDATISRSGVTTSTNPLLSIGAGSSIRGAGVTLDSSSGTSLDPTAQVVADAYYLNSGRISLQLGNPGALLPTTGLVLTESAIQYYQSSGTLSLQSYSSIDIYGTGQVGSPGLSLLALSAGEFRGFNQAGGTALFEAEDILIENRAGTPGGGAIATASGSLAFRARNIRLGVNQVQVDQFFDLTFSASESLSGEGSGGLSTQGSLNVASPLITAAAGATRTLTATGAVNLLSPVDTAGTPNPGGLGATYSISGLSINAATSILLPSGSLSLKAAGGDLAVSGWLDVSGTKQPFYGVTKYTDAGEIRLSSDTGNVLVSPSGKIDVSAQSGGGNAGALVVSAANGAFTQRGVILGQAGGGGRAGSFDLDVLALPSLAALSSSLTSAGLVDSQTIRVRSGDVAVDGTDGSAAIARSFNLSADQGKITVTGEINASGATGGSVALAANGSVILENGSLITVAAQDFDNAGKGGSVSLEAGTQRNGVPGTGSVDIRTGSTIDLSVASLVAGNAETTGTSAYEGKFSGTLHIRAPQNVTFTDLLVNPINGSITGASSILVEGYRLYDLTASGGTITGTVQTNIFNNAQSFLGTAGTTTAGYTSMLNRLLANNAGLASVFVLAPGAEIINRTGNLTLGTASSTSTSDWNLSTFRFGAKSAPGVLTMRAADDLVFYNTLSDGFSPTLANTDSSWLWLAQPTLLSGSPLPVNTQSWSYRLVGGSDFSAANFRQAASAGSVRIGKNGGNNSVSGGSAALTSTAVAKWYQVIRTGSGDIDISAGGNVQLLNQLATLYTAGTRVTNPTLGGLFDVPSLSNVVGDEGNLGVDQQTYLARYTMAGGNIHIAADGNIERLTLNAANQLVADSSRQLPNNWLLRRGYVDPETGLFGESQFLVSGNPAINSTTWWINFSNFFEGVGALGGGNVTLVAGGNVSNVEAVIPTNARMTKGTPDAANLLELGGGDLSVRAGNNIGAGVYYVERGAGSLTAGGSIVTNSTRSPSTTNLTGANRIEDSSTWLPTTLFVGKGGFDITAKGSVLLGPAGNPFLLPPGLTNSYLYKTYFSTISPDSYVNVTSLGGNLALRTEAVVGSTAARPLLQIWSGSQQLLGSSSSGFYQPWLRLAEDSVLPFGTIASIMPSTLRATAVSGSISLSGDLTLSPSPTGTIELLAGGGISGLQQGGREPGTNTKLWIASTINLSDANPASVPGITSPFAYQTLVGTASSAAVATGPADFLQFFTDLFTESGATSGTELSVQDIQARHMAGLLHKNDPSPTRLYATIGDISGLTLFSPKSASIIASRDISDIGFYIQNLDEADSSIVAGGRDILPYQKNSPLRKLATAGGSREISGPLPGDLQISGPGSLQVLAGRNLDLGTGREVGNGIGVGIASTGNIRNTYLSSEGADLFVGAGTGFSQGLFQSSLNFSMFISEFVEGAEKYLSEFEDALNGDAFESLPDEKKSEVALQVFYLVLRDAGRNFATTGNYDSGFSAIGTLFESLSGEGDIRTRERDIRTKKGGAISIFAPGGSLTLAKASSGARLAPPGIITESGGDISIFTDGDVSIGDGRIFVLRGGNQIIWSSQGDIAAGSAAKTVQSARPTQVTLDPQTASVETDLAGLATGGGIGVLATVKGIDPGDVDLIAPTGTVDAGDAGIRASGNLSIAATQVLNADNINVGGSSSGVPAAPVVAAPNIGGLTSGSTSATAASAAAESVANQARPSSEPVPEQPSIITVEIIGYGGGEDEG